MRHLDARELAVVLFKDPAEAQRALAFRLEDEEGAESVHEATEPPPPRGHRELLLHLVVCPRCRRKLAAILLTPAEPEEAGPGSEEAEDELPFEVQALLKAAEIELREDRVRLAESSADRALLEALLQVPASERLRTIHEELKRFASAGVAELLIGDAHQAAMEDRLSEARHLAFLATSLLESMPESTRHLRLLASAYSTLADVQRRCGILDGAEEFLATAVRQVSDDLVPDRSRAQLCLSLGFLRKEQGRLDEAVALFQRARNLSEDLGAFDEQAKAALALGWTLLEELEEDIALEPLWEAYSLLDDTGGPCELFLSALHALLLIHAVHDPSALPQLFGVLEELGKLLPPPLGEVRVARIKAQVTSRQGKHLEAAIGFGIVFSRLMEEGLAVEAAAAALELARHVQDDRTTPDALRVIQRQAGTLELAPELAAVVSFALALPLRCPESYFMDTLAQAERWLQRARFNPHLPFFPLAEPDELIAWNQLPEARRASVAAKAGVELRPVPDGKRSPRLEPQTSRDRLLISWTYEATTGARIVFSDFSPEEDETVAG